MDIFGVRLRFVCDGEAEEVKGYGAQSEDEGEEDPAGA